MSNEAEKFKQSSINSFRLGIEHFNRPQERGRINAVLIFFNHSFEMIMKGALLHKGVQIRSEDGEGKTISFKRCVNLCENGTRENPEIQFLTSAETTALRAINLQRDAAVHEYIDITEHQIYSEARRGIDIFEKILEDVFDENIADYLPQRDLPLSTHMPTDMTTIISDEIGEIRRLVGDGSEEEARARALAIESLDRAVDEEEQETPSKSELDRILEEIGEGENLEKVFPNVFSTIAGTEEGERLPMQLGSAGTVSAQHVSESDEEEDAYFFVEKNVHDRYPLFPHDVRDEVRKELDSEISWIKIKSVIYNLGLFGEEGFHQELSTGTRGEKDKYHPKIVDRVCEAIETNEVNIDECWKVYKEETDWMN